MQGAIYKRALVFHIYFQVVADLLLFYAAATVFLGRNKYKRIKYFAKEMENDAYKGRRFVLRFTIL